MSPPTDTERELSIRRRVRELRETFPHMTYKAVRLQAEREIDSRTHLRGRFR